MATATDTFTGGTLGDALTTHTADTGETWTLGTSKSGSMTLDGAGAARGNIGEPQGQYYSSFVPGAADYDVTVTVGAYTSGNLPYPIGRYATGADTFIMAFFRASIPQWEIREYNAGSPTTLASGTSTAPVANDVIKLNLVGTTVKLYVNASNYLTGTTTITAVGRPGIGPGDTTANTATAWSAVDAGGGASAPMFRGS